MHPVASTAVKTTGNVLRAWPPIFPMGLGKRLVYHCLSEMYRNRDGEPGQIVKKKGDVKVTQRLGVLHMSELIFPQLQYIHWMRGLTLALHVACFFFLWSPKLDVQCFVWNSAWHVSQESLEKAGNPAISHDEFFAPQAR